jgi:hypothetical protein
VSSSGITGTHDAAKIDAPGIVTGRYGTLGEVYLIREPFWPLNTTLFVKDFKGSNPYWLLYLLRSMDFSRQNAAGLASIGTPYTCSTSISHRESYKRALARLLTRCCSRLK